MKPLNILLAVDDSEASLHACRLVAGYAGDRSKIRIKLLNVQRPPLRLSPDFGVDQAALEAAMREQGERELEQGRALLVASGHQPERMVKIGPPADTILDVARQCENRVLVMGSGRHGPLGGYAMGSVALRVAPAAECPVVLVGPGVQLPSEVGIRLRVAAPVDAGISHDVHRLAGEPKADIALFARRQGAELIAMGTRGTGAMHHLLLGSAALKTALVSDIPVAFMR